MKRLLLAVTASTIVGLLPVMQAMAGPAATVRVPEPGTIGLFAAGAAAVALLRNRKGK